MLAALVNAVANPVNGIRIVEVPEIREARERTRTIPVESLSRVN
jgi:hypothetical protein